MTTVGQDLRYALRMLARSPGFTAVAVATLALGIGANTAIFSVVHAVLLKPLPFDRPGELVRVTADLKGQGLADAGVSPPELFDYRDRSGAFSQISGLYPINANITGMDRPERAEVLLVDIGYFDLLGVKPQVGRFFEKPDYRPGIAEIAVISDGWWRRHYAADPGVDRQDVPARRRHVHDRRRRAARLPPSGAVAPDGRRGLGAVGLERESRSACRSRAAPTSSAARWRG